MSKQVPVTDNAVAADVEEDGVHSIAPDLAYRRLSIVNVVLFGAASANRGDASDASWVLIDAGIPGMAGRIRDAAAERFGSRPPEAVILTHGHVDHVGSLHDLLREWDVPVYAHDEEIQFLDGTRSYPPPDPSVGGGLMSLTSPLFPKGPFDFGRWLRILPSDGAVPGMPGWRWIHTPGHTPGHVSLWRAEDRSLIAGDAFVTTKQESVYAVMTQRPEVHGPPMYFTPDWPSAGESVRRLAALDPELVVTGHGRALQGPEMRGALHLLADNFESIAIPKHGRYADGARASRDADGSEAGPRQ